MKIEINTKQFSAGLTEWQRNQLPFAASLAINAVTRAAQSAAQSSLDRNFTIAPSKAPFMKRLVNIPQFATKARMEAIIAIQGPGTGPDRSFLLGRHELGGTTIEPDPTKPFMQPSVNIRDGDYALVPRSLYPSSLRLVERRDVVGTLPPKGRVTRKGTFQLQGKRGTFVLDPKTMFGVKQWGVYQREGPNDVRLLWIYRVKQTNKPRLKFYETVREAVTKSLEKAFRDAMARALATAR